MDKTWIVKLNDLVERNPKMQVIVGVDLESISKNGYDWSVANEVEVGISNVFDDDGEETNEKAIFVSLK